MSCGVSELTQEQKSIMELSAYLYMARRAVLYIKHGCRTERECLHFTIGELDAEEDRAPRHTSAAYGHGYEVGKAKKEGVA